MGSNFAGTVERAVEKMYKVSMRLGEDRYQACVLICGVFPKAGPGYLLNLGEDKELIEIASTDAHLLVAKL